MGPRIKTKRGLGPWTTVKDARCFEWSILPILSSSNQPTFHLLTLSLSLSNSPLLSIFSFPLFISSSLFLFPLFSFSLPLVAVLPPSSLLSYHDFSCLYNPTANNRKHVIFYSAYHTHYDVFFPLNQVEFIAGEIEPQSTSTLA